MLEGFNSIIQEAGSASASIMDHDPYRVGTVMLQSNAMFKIMDPFIDFNGWSLASMLHILRPHVRLQPHFPWIAPTARRGY